MNGSNFYCSSLTTVSCSDSSNSINSITKKISPDDSCSIKNAPNTKWSSYGGCGTQNETKNSDALLLNRAKLKLAKTLNSSNKKNAIENESKKNGLPACNSTTSYLLGNSNFSTNSETMNSKNHSKTLPHSKSLLNVSSADTKIFPETKTSNNWNWDDPIDHNQHHLQHHSSNIDILNDFNMIKPESSFLWEQNTFSNAQVINTTASTSTTSYTKPNQITNDRNEKKIQSSISSEQDFCTRTFI